MEFALNLSPGDQEKERSEKYKEAYDHLADEFVEILALRKREITESKKDDSEGVTGKKYVKMAFDRMMRTLEAFGKEQDNK